MHHRMIKEQVFNGRMRRMPDFLTKQNAPQARLIKQNAPRADFSE